MKRTRDLELRLKSLETLNQAIGAMKSLSAHHLREVRAALEPAVAYREGIDRIVQSTGASLPAGRGGVGILVIGAELGFCGGYNSRVATAGVEQRARSGDGPTACLGRRAAKLLARFGVVPDRVYAGPTSVGGSAEVLLKLAEDILEDYLARGLSRFEIVASCFGGIGQYEVVTTTLLPIHVQPSLGAPAPRYAAASDLDAVAVQELLYIGMVERLLDALAAEHGARLAAAQAAEHWLGERIEQLRRGLMTARREGTTQEVIEISAGSRVHARRAR